MQKVLRNLYKWKNVLINRKNLCSLPSNPPIEKSLMLAYIQNMNPVRFKIVPKPS